MISEIAPNKGTETKSTAVRLLALISEIAPNKGTETILHPTLNVDKVTISEIAPNKGTETLGGASMLRGGAYFRDSPK